MKRTGSLLLYSGSLDASGCVPPGLEVGIIGVLEWLFSNSRQSKRLPLNIKGGRKDGSDSFVSVYSSQEILYAVLNDVFEAVAQTPQNIDAFTSTHLVVRIRISEPEGEILLDGRASPMEVFYGERPGKANLEISMQGDLLHSIWTGAESTAGAFMSGKIKTRGNIMKAMKLVDLFRECERVYPEIARVHGL